MRIHNDETNTFIVVVVAVAAFDFFASPECVASSDGMWPQENETIAPSFLSLQGQRDSGIKLYAKHFPTARDAPVCSCAKNSYTSIP